MNPQHGTIGRGRAGPGASTSRERRWLDGKVGIVTGASRGIGAAVARALASAGAHLSLAARDVSALEQLTRELGHRGRHAVAVPTDVTDPDAVEPSSQTPSRRSVGSTWRSTTPVGVSPARLASPTSPSRTSAPTWNST